MKSRLILRVIGVVLSISLMSTSCFNEGTDKKYSTLDSVVDVKDENKYGTEFGKIIWEYDAVLDTMVKHPTPKNLNYEMIIQQINERYPLIQVDFVRIGIDTIFVKIENASHLTQRIGTTGAHGYMSELVYSLTELPSIQMVDINFEEGDHAVPGLYRREDLNNKL